MRRAPALPLPLEELGRPLRRTRRLLAALALAGAGALVASALLLGGNGSTRSPTRPGGRLIVVDLSGSMDLRRLAARLRPVVRRLPPHAHVGLIVFSDTAYEAFPPTTGPGALRQVLAAFNRTGHLSLVPAATSVGGLAPVGPPWGSFASGTAISSGLRLAGDIVVRDHLRHAQVQLVSDLDDALTDHRALRRQLERLRRLGVRLQVLGLSPSPRDLLPYRDLLGGAAFEPLPPASAPTSPDRGPSFAALALAGALAALACGMLVALAVPLDLRRAGDA